MGVAFDFGLLDRSRVPVSDTQLISTLLQSSRNVKMTGPPTSVGEPSPVVVGSESIDKLGYLCAIGFHPVFF